MRNRKNDIHVFLSDNEYMNLIKKSINSKLSKSDIVRLALAAQDLKEAPPKKFYDLLNKINNIGININQIAKVANSTGEIYFNDLKIYFSEISKLIYDIRKKYL